MLLQPLVFLLRPPKAARSCHLLLLPVAGCAVAEASPPPYYSHRWLGHPSTPVTHTPVILRRRQRSRTSEPSYSSPRGHPLPRLPRIHVVPFLGLVVVHIPGALDVAWSMWCTNDFHRKSTVHGEADSWVHGRSKEVPPYYAQNSYSSTRQQGPTRRATVFREKMFPP